jgi:hypothetical protein
VPCDLKYFINIKIEIYYDVFFLYVIINLILNQNNTMVNIFSDLNLNITNLSEQSIDELVEAAIKCNYKD